MDDDLAALEALHRDLEALRDSRLAVIDRLSAELDSHLEEFQSLFDHKRKNDVSRKKLSDGEITVNNVNYSINEDFRQQTIQVADELDLDEVECAMLFLAAQKDADELDRSPIVSAIIRFQRRRQFLLECIRLIFQTGMEYDQQIDAVVDEDDPIAEEFKAAQLRARDILKQFTNRLVNVTNRLSSSPFWPKCLAAMVSIESGIQRVADRTLRASVVGTSLSRDEEQIMTYERETYNIQHELLSAICCSLIEQGAVSSLDFQKLLDRVKALDKHDHCMIHYIPLLMRGALQYTSYNLSGSEEDVKKLHRHILSYGDSSWGLRSLQYAFLSWWIVEYKGRIPDGPDDSNSPEAALLSKSLKEGGLLFMLSVSQDVRRNDWRDPAKVGLTKFLLRDSAVLPSDVPPFAEYFQELVMVHFQLFVQGFIQNMPDTLRQLKYEEDDQRKFLRSRFQTSTDEYQYHLDTFLVIVAYSYQDSPESANEFWATPDGNLYGFLQWGAKRQTTPRVAAFCEMLRSLSEGTSNADRAHNFLLEEGVPVAGKLRRTASLSWNQVLAELTFYSSNLKDRQPAPSLGPDSQNILEQLIEPESPIMLECYLRLVSHICSGSEQARKWVLSLEEPSLPLILFQLCSSNTESRLRGCAFAALASLLTDKTVEVTHGMWLMLDNWICGGLSPHSTVQRQIAPNSSPEQRIFDNIAQGFEESNSFMTLMNSLVLPSADESTLNDGVPFPETLGSSYRTITGIDPYIDFAMGKIFSEKTFTSDAHQQSLLRLNCLDFICTCLSSFNEDLVIIANRSPLPVESTMQTSSLQTYLVLHPFARVMEWLFEDGCLKALFAAAHQDVEQVNQRDANSPIVLALVRAIEVMNLVMKLQSTYFDIVRPALTDKHQRKSVTPTPVPSFEDAFLRHLNVFVDLGLYCGLGHAQLTLVSLALIERLATSRKLNSSGFSQGRRSDKSRLITVLEKDDEGERISRSMITAMAWDEWEYEVGPAASGYSIKSGILGFLKSNLLSNPDRPAMAHLLLGLSCGSASLEIDTEGLFANAQSLFHAVARLSLEYPDNDGQSFLSWASNIKEACIEILRLLWVSPVSSGVILQELRASDYLFYQAVAQVPVAATTPWDGLLALQPDFSISDSAIALRNFFRERSSFYDLFARELRYAKGKKIPSMTTRLHSTLLGSTTFAGANARPNQNIFELFDFMEVEFSPPLSMPELENFKMTDFDVCRTDSPIGEMYNLSRAEEVIAVCRTSFFKSVPESLLKTEEYKAKQAAFDEEAALALLTLLSQNQHRDLKVAQAQALKSWIKLLVVVVEACQLDAEIQGAFFQQAFQLILPKFEKACAINVDAAIDLAGLLNVLMTWSHTTPEDVDNKSIQKRSGANDVEFQVFRAVASAIISNASTIDLRGPCYQICCQYLRTQSRHAKSQTPGFANRAIKLVNERLINVVCDDAYTSDIGHRISSLLVLEGLVAMPFAEETKSVLGVLDRVNFVGVLVDTVKQIPIDLRHSQTSDVPIVVAYHNACLALLLRISQSRAGAILVFNAGIFSAIEESEIFMVDPDVGLEMEDAESLQTFFDLALSLMRIINSVALKFQSDQTVKSGRAFLSKSRACITGILKRYAGVSVAKNRPTTDLSDLVDNITLLISATDFLEFEDSTSTKKPTLNEFFS